MKKKIVKNLIFIKFANIREKRHINMKYPKFTMKLNLIPYFLLFGVLFSLGNYAYSQDEKNFRKLVKQADYHFLMREAVIAEELYQQALQIKPDNFYVMYRLARTNWYQNDLDEAIQWYKSAIDLNPNASDTILYDYAVALKKAGRCDEAVPIFQDFLKKHKEKDYLYKHAELEIRGCDFWEKISKKEPEYRVRLLSFNSESSDFDPNLYTIKNDSFIIFTSHRAGSRGKKKYLEYGEAAFSDLWVVKMENDSTYGKPENLGKKINTKANDGGATISPDGKTMYYTICGAGKFKKFYGCSIYQSQFNPEAKKWGKFQKVPGINGTREVVVNSRGKTKKVPTYDAQPQLSTDGNTMYFISDRDGGYGETDIWFSQRKGEEWTTPVNCGKMINTEFNEIYPFIGEDGVTLYFSSDGHVGVGGYDVYKVEGQGTNWSEPENLGIDINTTYDDFSIMWIKQDTLGMIASDRPGGTGRDDIYMVYKIIKPPVEITVHGTVRDKQTKQAVPFAIVTLFKTEEDGSLVPIDTFQTDQTGAYKFPLEKGFDYKLVGNAPEYLANEVFVSTKGIEESKQLEADIDIFLERIEIDKPIVLQNIYFDFDKADLRPESIIELNKIAKLLLDNPGIIIEIGAHTDTNGSEEYNIKLSQRRAESVVNYLIQSGVSKDRIIAFGYGESQPLVYPELSDADEQMNRRVEFRIRSIDYKAELENQE